nr:MAG: hypothetical protein [Podoviridae sp. ctka020]
MVKASQSLKTPMFQDKEGNEVKLQGSNDPSTPFERFSKNPPGGSTMLGSKETTYLMCPASTILDAEKAGVDLDNGKELMKWFKGRRGPTTNVFKATVEDKSIVWVLEKNTGVNPADYVCLPYEGLVKKK